MYIDRLQFAGEAAQARHDDCKNLRSEILRWIGATHNKKKQFWGFHDRKCALELCPHQKHCYLKANPKYVYYYVSQTLI